MDPNHAHEFNPSRKGCCKTIIGARICGGEETDEVHVRFREKRDFQRGTVPFEQTFEVQSGDTYDTVLIVFDDVFDTEKTREFVEDAIREKLERL